jgi:formate-dependent nitrite reductase cytochrome c552 subunit
MKTNKFFQFLTLAMCAVTFAFVTGCEGPVGPVGPQGTAGADGANGTDGKDGVDGNVTCLECHSADMPQIILEQFNQSVHSAGQIAVDYAGGRASCARCHSSEGFIEYARTGAVAENISAPSAWECKTCHSIHSTFEAEDFALRLADPVTLIFDKTTQIDLGNSNLCANCHQTRTPEPNLASPGDTYNITSTHYGPHRGPQANVLAGVGFAEIPGSFTYPTAGSSPHMDENGMCVGCHMYDYGNGAGGHTWNPALDACNTCHEASDTNFDHNNVQTEIAGLLEELRDLLVAQGVVEYVVADEAYEPVVGTHSMVQAQAFFNWIGLEEDRSLGVHNPAYAKALLENSIEALEP